MSQSINVSCLIVAAQVENVKVLYDIFVEWPLLTDDRGEITMYEIMFYSDKSNGTIIELDDETSVYEPNVTDDFPMTGQPVYVIVSLYVIYISIQPLTRLGKP